jgi:hypothetical protein
LYYSTKELSPHLNQKARNIIKKGEWYTSTINVEELFNILERRKELYAKVYENDFILEFVGKKLIEFYRQSFKAVAGSNRNDVTHVENLYNYLKMQMNKTDDSAISQDDIPKIQSILFPILRTMKVRLGELNAKFQKDPVYNNTHVVPSVWKHAGKKLKRLISKKVRDSVIKEDIRMFIDATIFSDVQNLELTLLTTDKEIVIKKRDALINCANTIYPNCLIDIRNLADV